MAVYSNSYAGRYGTSWVSDSLLANVRILGVKRAGVGYTQSSAMPVEGERTFYYDQSIGRIHFAESFGLQINENRVFVMWKE